MNLVFPIGFDPNNLLISVYHELVFSLNNLESFIKKALFQSAFRYFDLPLFESSDSFPPLFTSMISFWIRCDFVSCFPLACRKNPGANQIWLFAYKNIQGRALLMR